MEAQCAIQFDFSPGGITFRRMFERDLMPMPEVNRWLGLAQASSMSNGFSGISNMSAPPLSAAYRAIQPAWRPITSITITRS